MNYKDKIIAYIAEQECKKISEKVVKSLRKITEGLQTGCDSCLKNLWDEICVQVQYEYSIMWDFYMDIIRSLIQCQLDKLDIEVVEAIWLQTDEGSYQFDNDDDLEELDYSEEDITEYISEEYVISIAANWKNKRIEKYIETEYESGDF